MFVRLFLQLLICMKFFRNWENCYKSLNCLCICWKLSNCIKSSVFLSQYFFTISAIYCLTSISYGSIKRYRRIFGFQNEYTIGVIIWKAIRMCGNTLTESSNFIRPMKWYMYESSCRNSKDYLSALRIEIQKINTQKPAFISNVSYDRDWSKHNLKKMLGNAKINAAIIP